MVACDVEQIMTNEWRPNMTTKPVPWEKLPLTTRIASILYPSHVDQATRDEMQRIADAQGKRSPQQRFEKRTKP